MILWRISPFLDLNGEGGLRFSARWHSAGNPVVYLAESPPGALLEICANTTAEDVPPMFVLLKVVGPAFSLDEVPPDRLPVKWVGDLETTRKIGNEWLHRRKSALLRVPSSLVPETANYLINPLHPDATLFQIERHYEYPFDLRLKS